MNCFQNYYQENRFQLVGQCQSPRPPESAGEVAAPARVFIFVSKENPLAEKGNLIRRSC